MEVLTKDEYKELMNKVGSVAKFYISHIEGVKSNPDFSDVFDKINKYKGVRINDRIYAYPMAFRFIDRDNETICLTKNMHSNNDEYEDKIIYYLTVDFNKKIKMHIDYNALERNEYNSNNIYFEVLENYNRKECGDIYGNGRIIYEEENGYKGMIITNPDICVLEYGKYNYDHTIVILPEETYDSNPSVPELKDIEKEAVVYKLTQGVNNPVYLALNELQKERTRHYQRIR